MFAVVKPISDQHSFSDITVNSDHLKVHNSPR